MITLTLPIRGVLNRPPIASIASQNAPAPSPRSTRPPLRRSRLATAFASTAGGRSGRLSTLPARRMRSVRAATQLSSVQVSRKRGWYGWSWKVTRSSPTLSADRAAATTRAGSAANGVRKAPKRRSWP